MGSYYSCPAVSPKLRCRRDATARSKSRIFLGLGLFCGVPLDADNLSEPAFGNCYLIPDLCLSWATLAVQMDSDRLWSFCHFKFKRCRKSMSLGCLVSFYIKTPGLGLLNTKSCGAFFTIPQHIEKYKRKSKKSRKKALDMLVLARKCRSACLLYI